MVQGSAGEKENEILEAARKRFAHYGFSKVTMDEIANDVNMGKASLYYYFPTKEKLFESAIKKEESQFVSEIENILEKNISASQKMREYVDQRLKYFQELLNLGALSIYSFYNMKKIFINLFQNFEKYEVSLFSRIIREGIEEKEFSPEHDEKTAEVLVHILQGLRLRVLRTLKGQPMEKKLIKELHHEMMCTIEIFIKGLSK